MELEREDIERRDFSTSRRGYEPAEVDGHLREVAAGVERLRVEIEELSERSTLSGVANERLRRILDAAEASAAEIRTEAEEEAHGVLEEARREARTLTRDSEREARQLTEETERRAREREQEAETAGSERLTRIEQRTDELLSRADSLDAEFDAMLERMRAAASAAVDTLRLEVDTVRGELEELAGEGTGAPSRAGAAAGGRVREIEPEEALTAEHPTVASEPVAESEPLATSEPVAESEPVGDQSAAEPLGDEVIPEPSEGDELPEPPRPKRRGKGGRRRAEPAVETSSEPEDQASEGEAPARELSPTEDRTSDADVEGARLIALNMALSGSSRRETADYLRETFGLEDPALLDDVYDRVQAS